MYYEIYNEIMSLNEVSNLVLAYQQFQTEKLSSHGFLLSFHRWADRIQKWFLNQLSHRAIRRDLPGTQSGAMALPFVGIMQVFMPVLVCTMQKRHVSPNFVTELIFGNTI